MNYSIIIRPLIGAGIGYITNWIAVKMMFRPLHPIKIGKFTLPFTPGIIPKNKQKLAESIGNTISNSLLTDEDLKQVLLSENIKNHLKESILAYLKNLNENNSSVESLICSYVEHSNYITVINNIETTLSKSIYDTVLEANLGKLITEQIELAAHEKLKGSMLGFLGGNAIVSSITSNINTQLDEYIENNGQTLISDMVKKELNKYTSKPISEISTTLEKSNFDISAIIINLYEKMINEKASEILKIINISKIVTEKIDSMDVLELEKLILIIMKKELNALVNLGALIGFVLGFLNLLF